MTAIKILDENDKNELQNNIDLNKQILQNNIDSNKTELQGKIDALTSAVNASDENLQESINSLASTHATDKESLENAISTNQSNIDTNRASISANRTLIKENYDTLNGMIETVSNESQSKDNELEASITSLSTLKEDAGTAENAVSIHNTSAESHNDIRLSISGLTTRLNTLADSDDTTLDQLSEIVAYIKNNKTLIDGVTTSKVNVSDIVDDLVANVSNKPLSAAQGVALKALIEEVETGSDSAGTAASAIDAHNSSSSAHNDIRTLISSKVNVGDIVNNLTTNESDKPLSAAQGVALKSSFDSIPSWAMNSTKPSYTADEVGAEASGAVVSAVSEHDSSSDAHSDIRGLISDLTNQIGELTARIEALEGSSE